MPKTIAHNREPRIAIAIMAAGKGTRLKSKYPKVLHEVGGEPLLAHVVAAAKQVVPAKDVYAIVGHEADLVKRRLARTGIGFVLQEEQRGTGHALMMAREALAPYDHVIVLSGDAPMITPQTIGGLRDFHLANKAAMTLLSAELENPTGYGRVLRQIPKSAEVKAIVEEKSATPAQRRLREINSGFYAFDVKDLFGNIDQLGTDNAHREYYLTDMARVLNKQKKPVLATKAADPNEILGGNTRAELVEIDRRLRQLKCLNLMANGVTIFYPETCVIDSGVEVGTDTVIEPFVQLRGTTKIGAECRIHSYSLLTNSSVGDNVVVNAGTLMEEANVAKGATIGPYARLRPGSEIGEGAHVGNFVETKKIRLGKGSKANHLTYLGDAEIGEGVNVGAGTITCNYDGVNKHKTIIGDRVFVGSDTTLVAPITVGSGAYIGAASCLTDDVPEDALAIGRARQAVKEGWAKEKRAELEAARKK
jgi:bifunctional UDP-N-acetylglucosamine pyrophosphorylase/glucosamine-1-phosphate N-acetyltransferase